MGNKNAMKHGHYAMVAVEQRRALAEFLRRARETLEAMGEG